MSVNLLPEGSRALKLLKDAKRKLASMEARDDLIKFTKRTMPDPADPEDSEKSRYDDQYFHRALAAALQEVEAGRCKRLIVTFPPRHGKSELTSKRFLAWFLGRNPYLNIIFGTYNQDFADDFGRSIRDDIINTPEYAEIFPGVSLRDGSSSANRLQSKQGGVLFFVGRGGPVTGRGGHGIVIDDPLKNSIEADSEATRNQTWDWLTRDVFSRFMTDDGWIVLIMTRWHEDDPVGRLTDPKNPHYNAEEAAQWKIFNIPAIAEENDVLGREPGTPLWPSRFGLDYLLSFKRRDSRGFNALFQQRPAPEDGAFFKAEHLREYGPADLPPLSELEIYAASDHAVATKQHNDRTCLMVVGVDKNDNIWVLPDLVWKRIKTDTTVDEMIRMMKKYEPNRWFGSKDHIAKSIGPFLKKRMREEKLYILIKETDDYADKVKKAQAIQGRMSMGMVYLPRFAPWYQDAKDELLKFPYGTHDDFVDTLATVGRELTRLMKGTPLVAAPTGPKVGSWGWLKKASKDRSRAEKRRINMASM